MRLSLRLVLCLLPVFCSSAALAKDSPDPRQETPSAPIEIHNAFAKPSYGQTQVGAGFMEIHNLSDQPDRLIAVSAPMADATEIHTNEMDGDIMRMRRIDGLDIPASGSAALTPGNKHLMFFRMKQPLKAGMIFPVRLQFQHAGMKEVEFIVKP